MPLRFVQIRRMEMEYWDLDRDQRALLVGNALRALPEDMDPRAGLRGMSWYSLNPVLEAERPNPFTHENAVLQHRPNPYTSLVARYALGTTDMQSPAAIQFFENLYEQLIGPLDQDPPPRQPPAPAPPPPEIRVRRSVIGWSDPVSAQTINTGDRVIRLHRDDRMIFGEQELLVWFNTHPDNPTNPLTRQAAPPSEREAGVAVVEEDAGPPPPAGGRRRRRRVTRKGHKARKSTRRRR